METSRNFERAIVARYNLTSDYQLAKLLEVKPSTISAHRTGDAKTFGESIGYRIAELLDLPAEYVLSCLAAERSKDIKVKKVWERLAELTRVAIIAPVLFAVTLAGSALVTSPDARARSDVYYVKFLRRWLQALASWAFSDYPSLLGGIARMHKILPALSLAALAACGSPDNHGYGFHYDVAGASGLRVRYDGYPAPSLAQLEALYAETETCTGIHATGPLVIFVHDTFEPVGVYGMMFLDTGTILISSLLDPDPHLSFWTYKHEFIHYLLLRSGFDPDRNAAHDSPLFYTCTNTPTTL